MNSPPPPQPPGARASRTLARRQFLQIASTVATASLATATVQASPDAGKTAGLASHPRLPALVDVNVSLGHWPLRQLPQDSAEALAAKLRANSVTHAWVGSFDALLHKDIRAVNARLADHCRAHHNPHFLPFGSVNPTLPDWEDDLRTCAHVHHCPGIRLYPNYHGYSLDNPVFVRLLRLATELDLVVQIALVMEDERMMHPRLRVDPVDPAPLPALVRQVPGLRLVLVNALRTLRGNLLREIVAAGEVYVEISMLEGAGGIGNLLETVPLPRLLFGSHAPLFYFESARLKLIESSLDRAQTAAIAQVNAARLVLTTR